VPVVKNVKSTGCEPWARNAWHKRGEAGFAWLAVLGVSEPQDRHRLPARLRPADA